ncbi:hypothetical protein HYW17_03985 [Candidatus Uhrbacteria bacterium]|nr:hypothetical protein [Candidatus Uhrbacteria bacterium]
MEQFKIDNDKLEKLKLLAKGMRKNILREVFVANSGHSGGALSMVEILASIFEHHATHYPAADLPPVVISKGHAAACLYAWLVEKGRYPRAELDKYRMLGSPFQGHVKPPTSETAGIPGFYPSGSLTHGLSLASGTAIAKRLDNPENPLPVFCILSDTEMQGGQIWEAAKEIAFHELTNLTVLCDDNGFGNDRETSKTLDIGNLADCWSSCGWNVISVDDGHSLEALLFSLWWAASHRGEQPEDRRLVPFGIHLKMVSPRRPTIIIARTIKGKGISLMENNNHFHGAPPDKEQFMEACRELGIGDEEKDEIFRAREKRALEEALKLFPREKAPRAAPAEAILELMREGDERLVVIAPELAISTKASKISEAFPERVYNFGVQEPHAMDAVAGLAFSGKIPIIMTFTNFVLLRTVDQIFQNIAPFGKNLLIVGTQDGLLQDGMSATPYNHYAIARSFYDSIVLAPADYNEAKALTREALLTPGYKFLFVAREEMPLVFEENVRCKIGINKTWDPRTEKWQDRTETGWSANLSKDANIIAAGSPYTWFAVEAAKDLYKTQALDVGVINLSTIKPLDKETLRAVFRASRKLLVVEKHSPYGGIYSAICEYIQEVRAADLEISHLPEKEWVGQSGTPDMLMRHYGLDQESIKKFLLARVLGK